MNLQQLKEKYSNQSAAATAEKKSFKQKVVGVLPATNNRVDGIETKVEALEKRLNKSEVMTQTMIQLLAEGVGMTSKLPSWEGLSEAYDALEEKQEKGEKKEKNKKKEKGKKDKKKEKEKGEKKEKKKSVKKASDKEEEFIVPLDKKALTPRKEEVLPEEVVEVVEAEVVEKPEPPKKKTGGRRPRLPRKQPLANEEVIEGDVTPDE